MSEITIEQLLQNYANLQKVIDDIREEIPQLAKAEKAAEKVKKEIQNFVKESGEEVSGAGYTVTLSERTGWDTKKLPGFAAAHPELKSLSYPIIIAKITKDK